MSLPIFVPIALLFVFPSVLAANLHPPPTLGPIVDPDAGLALPAAPSPTITTTSALAMHYRRGYPAGSFSSIPPFTLLRNCARGCLDGTNGGFYGIWDFANCAEDACACRADNQPLVVRSLSSCISTECGASDTFDYNGATSVYAIFCSSVTGDPVAVLPTASEGSEGLAPTTVLGTVTVTVSSKSASTRSYSSTGSYSALSTLRTTQTSFSSPFSASPSSTESSAPPTSSTGKTSGGSGGLSRQDILVVVFGVLGSVVAVIIGVWQGRNESTTRKTLRRCIR